MMSGKGVDIVQYKLISYQDGVGEGLLLLWFRGITIIS